MNSKKLQTLISAGVFSAALLSGAAYAADKPADTNSVQTSTDTAKPSSQSAKKDTTKKKATAKDTAQMGCSSANGCGSH